MLQLFRRKSFEIGEEVPQGCHENTRVIVEYIKDRVFSGRPCRTFLSLG